MPSARTQIFKPLFGKIKISPPLPLKKRSGSARRPRRGVIKKRARGEIPRTFPQLMFPIGSNEFKLVRKICVCIILFCLFGFAPLRPPTSPAYKRLQQVRSRRGRAQRKKYSKVVSQILFFLRSSVIKKKICKNHIFRSIQQVIVQILE
jgi:hypothetical protein